MKIAIDFDGVLHRYSKGWQDGQIYDPPTEGAVETWNKLKENYDLVVFTAREGDEQRIFSWMHQNGFDIELESVTNKKPKAFLYIDDRAIRFTNWKDVEDLIYLFTKKKKEKENKGRENE